jgi:hypothetical protein
MSIEPTGDELHELLGVYALDALDDAERVQVDALLVGSHAARAEVDDLRETAALLALADGQSEGAPPDLWARIEGQMTAERDTTAAPPPVDLAAERTRRARRGPGWNVVAPVAAAAAIAIGILGYQVADLRDQVHEARQPGAAAFAAAFERAANQPGAHAVTLASSGSSLGRIVVLRDGTGYLVPDRLAPLAADRTYQLWALVGDAEHPTAISAGVLGSNPTATAFKVSGRVVGFALTVEHAGGVISSTNRPVAAGLIS